MVDNGFIVKKDLQAGGFLASSQGALALGSGLTSQVDPPIIKLFHSNMTGVGGYAPLDIPEVPASGAFPESPLGGQLWIRTNVYDGNPPNTLYKYNSDTAHWDVMGPKSKFEGYFDTLYLVNADGYKPDDSTLANMKLKTLNCNRISTSSNQLVVILSNGTDIDSAIAELNA
jgi:hypothetical protein